MYAAMNACIGQCDWLSKIFTFGMIFLTKKKKKKNLHVLKIAYLHFKFDSIETMRNI